MTKVQQTCCCGPNGRRKILNSGYRLRALCLPDRIRSLTGGGGVGGDGGGGTVAAPAAAAAAELRARVVTHRQHARIHRSTDPPPNKESGIHFFMGGGLVDWWISESRGNGVPC